MKDMKKMLKDQQKINEAVKRIVEYFSTEVPYTDHLEMMIEAQSQILDLMEMAKNQAAISNPHEEVDTESIMQFLRDVRCCHQLLKPFAQLAGQVGFAEE
jgi:hypothetical protein